MGGGPPRGGGQVGLLSSSSFSAAAGDGPGWRGSVHVGYGALVVAAAEEEEGNGEEDGGWESEGEDGGVGCCCWGVGRTRRLVRWFGDVWVDPKASAVRRVVDVWWSRWFALVVLPALLVGCPFLLFWIKGLELGGGQPRHHSASRNAER